VRPIAEQDNSFFERDAACGFRLQMEYLKPELVLQDHGVRDTIVVYGSTRISEPAVARRRVERPRGAAAANPEDVDMIHRLAIAERVLENGRYYDVARELG
jgi:hypothetical protein